MSQNENKDLNPKQLADLSDRYVLGALEPDEANRFEAILASSQSAREAVADSVSLFSAVREALDAEPCVVKARQPVATKSSWALAGFAVAAALVLVFGFLSRGGGLPGSGVSQEDTVSYSGAESTPIDSLAEMGDFDWSAGAPAESMLSDDLFSDSLASSDGLLVADSPDWMLAAVVLAEKNPSDDMDHEMDGLSPQKGELP